MLEKRKIERVKVGPIHYVVEEMDQLDEKQDIFGEVQYGPCRLRLKQTLAPPSKRLTLWHEIIHIVLVHAGHRKHDERMVEALACGVMQVLQDNPFLREEG